MEKDYPFTPDYVDAIKKRYTEQLKRYQNAEIYMGDVNRPKEEKERYIDKLTMITEELSFYINEFERLGVEVTYWQLVKTGFEGV